MSSGWILCKDRLPETHKVRYDGVTWEESDEVLVCGKADSGKMACAVAPYIKDTEEGEGCWYEVYNRAYDAIHVIAWMPLPETDSLKGEPINE